MRDNLFHSSAVTHIRLNHFKEILSQFQAKETTQIPRDSTFKWPASQGSSDRRPPTGPMKDLKGLGGVGRVDERGRMKEEECKRKKKRR